MVDYHAQIVSALKTVLPVHYEMTLTSKTQTPCISYMELNNSMEETGDTIGYSSVKYQIKVWGNDIKALQKYALQIDDKLRPIGWRRVSSAELHDTESTMIQKILTYEALFLESF